MANSRERLRAIVVLVATARVISDSIELVIKALQDARRRRVGNADRSCGQLAQQLWGNWQSENLRWDGWT